ncbi:MAG TPA: SDR family oxidoreductase [Agriterribacter sp.]|nr:SDR family oxidoreductase [Agriterribacter sp.]
MPGGLLQDKIIFLTGGADGIGYECAKAYINAGARIIVADTNEEALAAFVNQYGKEHLGIVCDVSNKKDVSSALQKTLEQYGRLDAIHNNAGIAHPAKALHETTEEEWDRLMNVNLKSVYFTTLGGLEALKQTRGTILNTSSLVADIGQEIHAAYSATKGAMNSLTKSMALDYAKFGIRVNAVCPAGVWTPMLRKWSREQPDPAAMEAYLDHIHPLGYCPNGDVVADTCVFLLSEKARFITGCIMPVSGGAELGYRK